MFSFIYFIALLCTLSAEQYEYKYRGELFGYPVQERHSSTSKNPMFLLLNKLPFELYNNYVCNTLPVSLHRYQMHYPGHPFSYPYRLSFYKRYGGTWRSASLLRQHQLIRHSNVIQETINTLYPYWNLNHMNELYASAVKSVRSLLIKQREFSSKDATKNILTAHLQTIHNPVDVDGIYDAIDKLNTISRTSLRAVMYDFVNRSCGIANSDFYCQYLQKLKNSNLCSSKYYSAQIWNACCRQQAFGGNVSNKPNTMTAMYGTTNGLIPTAAVLASSGHCGKSTINPAKHFFDFAKTISEVRIVGGVSARECEYPWIVRLRVRGSLCAGSIIDRRHILTAAHCFESGTRPGEVEVYAGDFDLSVKDVNEVVSEVSKISIHPGYQKTYGGSVKNDIAVLKLKTPLSYNECVQPICLPKKGSGSKLNNIQCTVAGWGTTSFGGKESSVLQEVSIPTYSGAMCNTVFPLFGTSDPDTQICAGRTGADSCQGDSGGPLFCPVDGVYVQYGVVSFGDGCGEVGNAGVYTDVSSMLNFINSITT